MVTKIGRYPGIGGNREYTAGLGLFSTQDNASQTFITHHLHKWHRPEAVQEAVRRSSGNRTASVSKKNFFEAGEAVTTDRTRNTNRPIIL